MILTEIQDDKCLCMIFVICVLVFVIAILITVLLCRKRKLKTNDEDDDIIKANNKTGLINNENKLIIKLFDNETGQNVSTSCAELINNVKDAKTEIIKVLSSEANENERIIEKLNELIQKIEQTDQKLDQKNDISLSEKISKINGTKAEE